MRKIIMQPTFPLLFKDQQGLSELLSKGNYDVKMSKKANIQYLIEKNNKIN